MPLSQFARRRIPLRYIAPNAVTLCGLYVGLSGVKAAVAGDFESAMRAVLLAAGFDALDGRVARLVKGVSRFGAELDSLADFVNFGVVPAFIMYFWALHTLGNVGWAVCMVYMTACGLRLARFNVLDVHDAGAMQNAKTHFTGVPAPAGALLGLLPLLWAVAGVNVLQDYAPLLLLHLLIIAALMVGTFKVPALNGKHGIERRHLPIVLLGISGALLLAVLFPWPVAAMVVTAYYGFVLFLLARWAYGAP